MSETPQTPNQDRLGELFAELEEARRRYVKLANAYFAKAPVKHEMWQAEVELVRKLNAWMQERQARFGTPA